MKWQLKALVSLVLVFGLYVNNDKFSEYTGYAPGEKCSSRDLIMDLAGALNVKGVKLICYYAGLNGYMRDPQVSAGLSDSNELTMPFCGGDRETCILTESF